MHCLTLAPPCPSLTPCLNPTPHLHPGVHIADVTHFLHPATAMDDEASARWVCQEGMCGWFV